MSCSSTRHTQAIVRWFGFPARADKQELNFGQADQHMLHEEGSCPCVTSAAAAAGTMQSKLNLPDSRLHVMDRVSTSSKHLKPHIRVWSAKKVGAQYLAKRLSQLQDLISSMMPLQSCLASCCSSECWAARMILEIQAQSTQRCHTQKQARLQRNNAL